MSNAVITITNIDFGGLKWITVLRNRLCENGELNKQDIEEAFGYVLSDEEYKVKADIPETGKLYKENKKSLFKLRDNFNVNGLHDGEEIVFSPFFTLLYGQNGTGKTSYYRILKDAFHSKQKIRKNIFSSSDEPTSVKIDFINAKELKKQQLKGTINNFPNSINTFNWNPGIRQKSSIKFCDKGILEKSLVEKETGWSVDKYKLGYFKKFQIGINKVESEINKEIGGLQSYINDTCTAVENALMHESDDSLKQKINDSKYDLAELKQILEKAIDKELPEDVEKKKQDFEKNIGKEVSDLNDSIEFEKQTMANANEVKNLINERIEILKFLPRISKKLEKKII